MRCNSFFRNSLSLTSNVIRYKAYEDENTIRNKDIDKYIYSYDACIFNDLS